MEKVFPGRFTAEAEEPFVILRLGLRVNRLLLFWKWIPTLASTLPALHRLLRAPAPGLLGGFFLLYWSAGAGIVQYWRSLDDLEECVKSEHSLYEVLWQRYHASPGNDGCVGIWYEVFHIEAKSYEAVYANTTIMGLAAATKHVPATGRRETARRRLGGESEPAVASPPCPVAH